MREELAVLKKAKDDLQVRNEHQDAEINDLQVCLRVACRNATRVTFERFIQMAHLSCAKVKCGAWGRRASAKRGTPLIIHRRPRRIRV